MADNLSITDLDVATPLKIGLAGLPSGRKLLQRADGRQTLPGQPYVKLDSPELLAHLRSAHLTTELDKMAPYLWLITTPSETNIAPLHYQDLRGRNIILTEYPGLHLVWYYDRSFVKPIPEYMLTKAFWDFIREADPEVFRAALGFMRTYIFLIQHEVDFRQAVEMRLIPQVDGRPALTFEDFAGFIQHFGRMENSSVAARYRYGAMRLSGLNYLALLTIGKLSYFHVQTQWSEWFGRTFGPVLGIFAVFSLMLSSVQVGLAAVDLDHSLDRPGYAKACWWLSIFVLTLVAMISAIIFFVMLFIPIKKSTFALRMMRTNSDRLSYVRR